MNQYIDAFENKLKLMNFANQTIKTKVWKLNRFFEFLEMNHINTIDGITKNVIDAYRMQIYHKLNKKGEQNSIVYQNSILSTICQFTRFLYKQNFIVTDPGKGIKYAKTPKALPQSVLKPKEIKKIIHATDIRTLIGYRDRVILEVLYSSGIRKEEMNNLTVKDVDCDDGVLKIESGKGGRDRIVPIGRIARRYLENYISSVRPELANSHSNEFLFLTIRGRRFSKNVIWDIVKKYTRKAKIKKNVHPHTFRHTCATGMLKNKADLNSIRKLLGHASLTTTQIYTHMTINDLKDVHSKCHPREKDKL